MNIVDSMWPYLLVFVFGAAPFFEAYGVIALALIAGLSTGPVVILALLGNLLTVLFVIVFIEKIQAWRRRRKGEGEEEEPSGKRQQRARNLWKKYGLPGLALIGPMIVGSHLTALMSLTFGGTKKKTAYWMSGSIVFWSVVSVVLVYFGIDAFGLEDRNLFE